MKKKLSLLTIIVLFALLVPFKSIGKPFYINIRIGFPAKWSIVFGDCRSGWGICISLPMAPVGSPNFAGYDNESEKICLKIDKSSEEANNFNTGTIEIKEDSPVDSKLIAEMNNAKWKDKTVLLKKGNYKIRDDGNYYVIEFDYFIQ